MPALPRSSMALAAIVLPTLLLLSHGALAQTTAPAVTPPPHQTYALVAAMGHTYSFVAERQATASDTRPYDRRNIEAGKDVINRMVLHNLDEIIAASVPDSTRIYLSLPDYDVDPIVPSERAQAAIDAVIKALEKVPEHRSWDKIVVVTPAYRAQEKNGMAGKIGGIGIFMEPFCKSNQNDCEFHTTTAIDGPMAQRPDGTSAPASTFQAPFSYLCIWTLDPKTLAVLSKEESYSDQKLNDPSTSKAAPGVSMDKTWAATTTTELIDRSLHETIRRSGLTATVEVRTVKETVPETVPSPKSE